MRVLCPAQRLSLCAVVALALTTPHFFSSANPTDARWVRAANHSDAVATFFDAGIGDAMRAGINLSSEFSRAFCTESLHATRSNLREQSEPCAGFVPRSFHRQSVGGVETFVSLFEGATDLATMDFLRNWAMQPKG